MLASELDEISLEGAMLFEPRSTYDDGIIATMNNADEDTIAVYGYYSLIEALKKHDGMTYEEAAEWISYAERIIPYMGSRKPIIVREVER